MKYCASCGARFMLDMQGCTYVQTIGRKQNNVMAVRVAYFCSPECLGEYIRLDGKTENAHRARVMEV